MARVIEGQLVDPGGRFALVAARFNELLVERLVSGAEDALRRHGIDSEDRADQYWVPGAFEIPFAVREAAKSGKYAAVVALGCVIRGATPHFDMVAGAASRGVASVGLETGVPCIFGVLTVDSIEQAIERAGTKAGNHGYHAMCSAIEMASLTARMRG